LAYGFEFVEDVSKLLFDLGGSFSRQRHCDVRRRHVGIVRFRRLEAIVEFGLAVTLTKKDSEVEGCVTEMIFGCISFGVLKDMNQKVSDHRSNWKAFTPVVTSISFGFAVFKSFSNSEDQFDWDVCYEVRYVRTTNSTC
jgi:hypothetical protein